MRSLSWVTTSAAAACLLAGCGGGGEPKASAPSGAPGASAPSGASAASGASGASTASCLGYRRAVAGLRIGVSGPELANDLARIGEAATAAAGGSDGELRAALTEQASRYVEAAAAARKADTAALEQLSPDLAAGDVQVDRLADAACALGRRGKDETVQTRALFPRWLTPNDGRAQPGDNLVAWVTRSHGVLQLARTGRPAGGRAVGTLDEAEANSRAIYPGNELASVPRPVRNPRVNVRSFTLTGGASDSGQPLRGQVHVFGGQGATWSLNCYGDEAYASATARACTRAIESLGFVQPGGED